jgi:hypothetical protein
MVVGAFSDVRPGENFNIELLPERLAVVPQDDSVS